MTGPGSEFARSGDDVGIRGIGSDGGGLVGAELGGGTIATEADGAGIAGGAGAKPVTVGVGGACGGAGWAGGGGNVFKIWSTMSPTG